MTISIISDIRDILKEIPLSDILREKLSIAERSIEKLEEENIKLKKENAEKSKKINELQEELAAYQTLKDEFIEARGALFKRRPEGGYHETVFCFGCRSPLSSFDGDFPYNSCDRCQIHLDFSLKDLPSIIESLPK